MQSSARSEAAEAGGIDPFHVEALYLGRQRALARGIDDLLDGLAWTFEHAVDRPFASVSRMADHAERLSSAAHRVAIEDALNSPVGDDVCTDQVSQMPGVGLEPTRP